MLNRRQMIKRAGAATLLPFATQAKAGLEGQIAALERPLRVLVPNGSQANLNPVIEGFELLYDCPVELVVTHVDNINAMLALESLTQEHRIDVALPATFGIPDLAEGGAIRPIDAFVAEDAARAQDMLSMYRTGDFFDGKHWGYQTDGDVYLMFYHEDFLKNRDFRSEYEDRFGEALEIPKDWATLDRHLAFFHRPDDGIFGGCLFRTAIYAAWEWWARFHAQGVWPFSPEMEPQIDGEAGITAAAAMVESAAHLTGSDLGLFDNWARYRKGDVYANIGWGGTQKALNAIGSGMRDKVRPAQLPCGIIADKPVPIAYFNWGWSYVVTSHSPAQDVAYNFARHAVSASVSSEAVARTDGFFDPFREEHYNNDDIVNAYGQAFLTEHRTAMEHAMPDLYIARRNEYFDELSYWLGLALTREVTPEHALRKVAEAWRLITARVGQEAQAARWKALRRKYPEHLRRVLKDL